LEVVLQDFELLFRAYTFILNTPFLVINQAAERERVLRQQGILVDGSSDLSDKEDMEGASETVER
jgi:hypothetical protein